MRDPSPDCYAAALNLLQYAHNTKQKSLHYTGSAKLPAGGNLLICGMLNRLRKSGGLIAYSDATRYRGNELGHNSYGYVIYLFGAPIAYAAKNLKVIALSSAEAEYAAASHTCREVQFIRHVLMQLGFDLSGPTIMGVDNTAAIMAKIVASLLSQNTLMLRLIKFGIATSAGLFILHSYRLCRNALMVSPSLWIRPNSRRGFPRF